MFHGQAFQILFYLQISTILAFGCIWKDWSKFWCDERVEFHVGITIVRFHGFVPLGRSAATSFVITWNPAINAEPTIFAATKWRDCSRIVQRMDALVVVIGDKVAGSNTSWLCLNISVAWHNPENKAYRTLAYVFNYFGFYVTRTFLAHLLVAFLEHCVEVLCRSCWHSPRRGWLFLHL